MRKYFVMKPYELWVKYFKTTRRNSRITNFLLPIIIMGGFYYFQKTIVISNESWAFILPSIITFSVLIIGFSYSMIITMMTSDSSNDSRVKTEPISGTNISLFEGLLLNFMFIILNLMFVSLFVIFMMILEFHNFLALIIITTIIIISLLSLIEALSNFLSIYSK